MSNPLDSQKTKLLVKQLIFSNDYDQIISKSQSNNSTLIENPKKIVLSTYFAYPMTWIGH